MAIDSDIVEMHKMEMTDFDLRWRFIGDDYNNLPLAVLLNQLVPLKAEGAKCLSDFLVINGVHSDFPFKEGMFKNLKRCDIRLKGVTGTRSWLNSLGLNRDENIYLSWSDTCAMVTSWGIVINYYDDLFYPGSDDLTVFDSSLDWVVLFFHESQIYFGSRR